MKVGILGTRGIPNRYGGFEQFAEFLSQGLVQRGHEVWVYNSSLHPYREHIWNGVNIITCNDPEDKFGTAGQFIYDLNCIRDARKRDFDVLLQLGYTSSSVWGKLLPKKALIFTNMDGLEWKRSKYGNAVKQFLAVAEKWAVKTSDVLIADSLGIQQYLNEKYHRKAEYIAYGAELFSNPDPTVLQSFGVEKESYHMLIARMEPENNIEIILDGYVLSGDNRPFLVVGKTDNAFGQSMKEKFKHNTGICFTGGIYDQQILSNLRWFSGLYFHGHSVGGTNPSLLEAMASNALLAANNNVFNKTILGDDAFYFADAKEVAAIISAFSSKRNHQPFLDENRAKIENTFRWDQIISQYESTFLNHLKKQKS
jgi:glycosyltransferase involved in cell wall biosynthesis